MRRAKRHMAWDKNQESEVRSVPQPYTSNFCLWTSVFAGFLFFSLLPSTTLAQVGTCEESFGSDTLDVGNVRATIYNNGALFWNGGPNVYEIPKGSNISSLFATTFVVAGFIDNEFRSSAADYGPYEFWAGPLDAEGNPPLDCTPYDRVWQIRSEDFSLLENQGMVSENMMNWPWELGAPVIDGDGNPDNYNLEGGDRPELFGDQRLWWIMNDRGNEHLTSEVPPIGLEVHGSAFAFEEPGIGGDLTFYHYRLINKNTSAFTRAFIGIWIDPDLGNFADDFAGSDSLLHLGYAYNSDPIDEGGYEEKPPALGYTFLKTPIADVDSFDNDRDGEIDEPGEQAGMHAMVRYYGGGGVQGDPQDGAAFYSLLTGKWYDGQSITEGGTGRDFSAIPTRFMFSADPITRSYWSEMRPFPDQNSAARPGDRQFIVSSGPFTLNPGEHTDFVGAFVWAQGDDYLDSVRKLKNIVANMQTAPDSYLASGYNSGLLQPEPVPPQFVLGFDQNFPNPFSGTTTFRYSLPKTMQVRLAVYDILGREVAVLTEASQEAGTYSIDFDGTNLPPGTYFARIELDYLRFTKLMVKAQ